MKEIKIHLIKNLVYPKIISKNKKVPIKEIKKAYKYQIIYNHLFKSKTTYHIIKTANKLGLLKQHKENLGLFYPDLKNKKISLNKKIYYKDIITGKQKTTTLKKLLNEAHRLATEMIETAQNYSLRKITKDKASKTISGKSLDTGKIKVSISKIKYTL
jgi:ribosomal protein S16